MLLTFSKLSGTEEFNFLFEKAVAKFLLKPFYFTDLCHPLQSLFTSLLYLESKCEKGPYGQSHI